MFSSPSPSRDFDRRAKQRVGIEHRDQRRPATNDADDNPVRSTSGRRRKQLVLGDDHGIEHVVDRQAPRAGRLVHEQQHRRVDRSVDVQQRTRIVHRHQHAANRRDAEHRRGGIGNALHRLARRSPRRRPTAARAKRSVPTRKTRSRATPSRNMTHRVDEIDDRRADLRRAAARDRRRRPAIAACGMPKIVAVSRSCTTARPPAARIARVPSAPSRPMPVSTTADRRRAEDVGQRAKEDVGRGAHAPHRRRSYRARCADRSPSSSNRHVIPARRDVHAAVHDELAVLRFVDLQRAQCVEPLREALRESGRHVLHDEHRRRERPRQARQRSRRARAVRRSTTRSRRRSLRHATISARAALVDRRRAAACAAPATFVCTAARSASSNCVVMTRRSRLIDPDGLQTKSTAPSSSARKRRRLPAARRPGAQHHDGTRHLAHDVAERVQSIELRHVDVERDESGSSA